MQTAGLRPKTLHDTGAVKVQSQDLKGSIFHGSRLHYSKRCVDLLACSPLRVELHPSFQSLEPSCSNHDLSTDLFRPVLHHDCVFKTWHREPASATIIRPKTWSYHAAAFQGPPLSPEFSLDSVLPQNKLRNNVRRASESINEYLRNLRDSFNCFSRKPQMPPKYSIFVTPFLAGT